MSEVDLLPVIKVLPTQLANQIAAGEVIERPASVIKELIENALDADATRLDIELVNGGMESIVVTDDGHGVQANELPLAISRHATSKIESVEDLLNLHSLGFRGEALASICSVSQWEMISRPHDQSQAVKISHLMPDDTIAINHAPGTRVSIKQLFCNTPARRKFLRAERTEYRHCDDVIKRMALARFDVAFYVKHNGRQSLRLPAVTEDIGRSRRVAQICGDAYVKQSVVIDYPHTGMRLWGWLSQADYSRQSTDLQYFYINGRIIRDRVINHAVRLAYQPVLPAGRHAAYVLHLEIDPAMVDVNVHPTKYEVRFRESRIIHDFISRCIRDAIHAVSSGDGSPSAKNISHDVYAASSLDKGNSYQTKVSEQHILYPSTAGTRFGNVLTVVHERYALTQQSLSQGQQRFYLLDLQTAVAIWVSSLLLDGLNGSGKKEIKSLPLLIPQRLVLATNELAVFKQHQKLFGSLGFDLSLTEDKNLLIRKIPSLLQCYDSKKLIQQLLIAVIDTTAPEKELSTALFELLPDYKKLDLNVIFSAIELSINKSADEYTSCWRELTPTDLNDWLGG